MASVNVPPPQLRGEEHYEKFVNHIRLNHMYNDLFHYLIDPLRLIELYDNVFIKFRQGVGQMHTHNGPTGKIRMIYIPMSSITSEYSHARIPE